MLLWFNMQNDNKISEVTGWAESHFKAAEVSELKLSEAKLTLCVSDHFSESHKSKEGLKNPGRKKLHMKRV